MSEKSVPLSADWVRCQSKSRPDRYYMFNKRTGETSWCSDAVNITPQKTVSAKDIKTPAQDRLKRLQNNLQKKKLSELVTGGTKAGRQVEKLKPKIFNVGKKSAVVKERGFTQSPNEKQANATEKSETSTTTLKDKSPVSIREEPSVTRNEGPSISTKREISSESRAKYGDREPKFAIPKKRTNRADVSSVSSSKVVKITSETKESKINSVSPKSPCSLEKSTMGILCKESRSKISPVSRKLPCTPSSPDTNKTPDESFSSDAEPRSNTPASINRSLESILYDFNDNKQPLKGETKPTIMSKIKEFCSSLIPGGMKSKKRKNPQYKDKEKQAHLSFNSKPAFKPKKPETKAVLRGVLVENESASIQKQLPSLPHKLPSPIPVPNESANARLQRLRNSLHLQQTTLSSTPNTSATASTLNLQLEDSDVSSSICSQSVSTSECEPMDWQPISEEILDNVISSSSLSNIHSADSSSLSEHYDMVNENLMRLGAEKKQTKQWKTDHFYFVVDTNVFIQNITFIEELTAMKLCDTIGTIIYVPYCVLQELDKLKIRSPSESIKTRSTRAIKYLNKSFEDKQQRIQAQTATDETKHLIKVTSPDDSILNCCLQVKEYVENVLLLTEDINLQNKAKCNDILVSTKSDLISKHESLI